MVEGELDEAEKFLKIALKYAPKNKYFLAALANVYALGNENGKARDIYNKSVNMESNNPE
jgi:Tfp pilus assembly protein PilF